MPVVKITEEGEEVWTDTPLRNIKSDVESDSKYCPYNNFDTCVTTGCPLYIENPIVGSWCGRARSENESEIANLYGSLATEYTKLKKSFEQMKVD
jgi:hypothetical protein